MMKLQLTLIAAGLLLSGPFAQAADSDSDSVNDAADNCLAVANTSQRDTDGDNIGNACDGDVNNDCIVNFNDLSIYADNFFQSGDLDTDNNGDGITNFADLQIMSSQFFGAPGPSGFFNACNTASELAATASSNSELQPASLAVDGNLSTRWESIHGVDPGILILDLAQSYPLTRVEIHWEAANAQNYLIEASNDNFSWDTLAVRTGGQFGDRTDIVDIAGTYRYLRMNGQTRSVGNTYGYSIWEMDVFGDADAAIEIDVDADDDGVIDALDLCPGTPPDSNIDDDGCVVIGSVNEVASADGILVGGLGSSAPGFSLYVFDNDIGAGGSTCNGGCANTWPPVLVEDNAASGVANLSTITRDDGSRQAAHDGRPLYFFAGDNNPGDINGQGAGGVWWLIEYSQLYETLYDETTPLEPQLQDNTPTALVTRLADRARDRHAREAQFQSYDHWLSFYWEHRTAEIEIVDTIGKGGNSVTFNVTTEWPVNPQEAELRFFHLNAAIYADNGIMAAVPSLDVPGETRRHYTRSSSFNPLTGTALQVGDRMEFELSQFLTGTPNGRDNYYGTAILYVVGEGVVPWEAQGAAQNSFPMPMAGRIGGGTTLNYQYSDEPDNHFIQMPTNLSDINGQVFVLGRRVHHTDFGDGSHNEAADNDGFDELAGLLGTNYVNRSCVACHERNGRALPPGVNQNLNQYVVKVGDGGGNPDPLIGSVLQPQSTGGGTEGTVQISSWTESGGLRTPNFNFTGTQPAAFSARIAPQLVGMGLLEAIVDADIESLADPDDVDADGISGRMHLVTDPENGQTRIGRFGWKASQATVKHQVAAALNTDIGVMTSIRPAPDCGSEQSNCDEVRSELADEHLEKLTAYVSLLGMSARRNLNDPAALQGEALFASAGCTGCHTESFQTSAFHPHAELRDQAIQPYTDLLLHDMGPGLASTLDEGGASAAEWRTPPLWGIGLTSGVSGGEAYLHDGRARNLTEAILWHGGEGDAARQAFVAMSQAEKDALLAFLMSL
ncbi:MAG: c-type cytochrome [Gammaproteobacteria bacterium]|nr:c-type cytochrome [Gammaproteobacteria bacterium]